MCAVIHQQFRGLVEQFLSPTLQENQSVHRELRQVMSEKESLGLKVQEYSQQLLRYEEALREKEQQKAELMESCHTLNSEVERMEATTKKIQEEFSASKLELLALTQVKDNQLAVETGVVVHFGC